VPSVAGARGALGPIAALLGALLAGWGVVLDQAAALPQLGLWSGLHVASLGGAALGLAATWGEHRAVRAVAALLAWRLAYFPIMVFSGHVASIVEWACLAVGLPVFVYPAFLLAAATLHAGVAAAAVIVVRPPQPWLRVALAPAFVVAALVSFMKPADFHPLPDRFVRLDRPVPPPRAAGANPYLGALVGPGYFPTQRTMLLAAGLTYATIPPSPWATTVKAVLEGDFRANPFAPTLDRVREHYLAYHAAHPFLGCRDFESCPLP